MLALLVAGPALAQAAEAPSVLPPGRVTVLMWHPNDGVDPLGWPFGPDGADAFTRRYLGGRLHDYPMLMVDGVVPVEGLPGDGSLAATQQAYGQAVGSRLGEAAPATLRIRSGTAARPGGADTVLVDAHVLPNGALPSGLEIWAALTEDPVHMRPLLTNGVFDHRFTVRAAVQGPAVGPNGWNGTLRLPLDPAWDLQRLHVAVWLQQDGGTGLGNAWRPREVAQATHAPLGEAREQQEKGVLVEALSATWCDPCLIGDHALEDLAVAAGAAEPRPRAAATAYLREAPGLRALAGALLGAAAVLWVVRRR
ncbi:MAG TPA: hypothetical protein VFH47_07485 [Candidatus Thermoplasmatota archaeon]|nr:hypothetical protein [Candidatus Thermoplasmatota archaeon]